MAQSDRSFLEELKARGVSRREFLGFCASAAALLALPRAWAARIAAAVESAEKPTLVWLEFQDCAGNTESFLRASRPTVAQLILDTLTKRLASPDLQMAIVNTRVLGGAISRVTPDATAYAHREWPLMVNVAAVVGDPQALDEQRPWVEALGASLSDGAPGAYGNFVGDEGPDRIHDIYPPETYARLAKVKAECDPDNVFHHGHTVPPQRPAG